MSTTKPVTFITLRMGHHAQASGYDRLVTEMDGDVDVIRLKPPATPTQKALTRTLRPMVRHADATWYNRASLLAEFRTANCWLRTNSRVFHFLYGENVYHYMGRINKRFPKENLLVATYHTPDWRMQELVRNTRRIKELDAVIVMSRSQMPFFQSELGEDRVFFVPHGVDTGYFRPAPTERSAEDLQFLTVGHHLRDFEVLAEVATVVGREFPKVKFVVIAWPDRVGPVQGMENVICKSGVSDEELLNEYLTSDALLLPLRDATANNSLLEGMACGLPVLSTDLQGVCDYTDEANRILHPHGDARPMVDAVMAICRGELDLQTMSEASRRKALELDWKEIARMTRGVYDCLS